MFGSYRLLPQGGLLNQRQDLSLQDTVGSVTEGVRDIYVFPLGGGRFGIEAVRVLADDLVSTHQPESYAQSGRAARKLLRQWSLA
ncbi:hypothetical protein EN904_03015 [Mesorhizobium sp. M7A.F.Ca.CA.001.07.2.1]|uniref:hypothetical protein n=1 Tax=Mesorhizobium TaxID=68287 RepID=UPI000FCAFF94|nr:MULTISPECIES: hypothetical protein [Mesorhizobium]RVB23381.1 hypothetical protein EN918_28740 [Mesorhizobium sp. M7A.F.Ca.CA.004.05.1.1]MCF6126607.1 hypothetical protein [Mesorhizobium ciceri]MCQ8817709.1 hypothetical protein [Mesorhizobium sp. SEMIA396]MCQ8871914.1 hypothetical protein [Mesorhizobium sp. LMG17149]RUX68846.1 hypothetical protein EN983_29445 [Mesorhizobium sp. M7A.F.Ca.CA.004.08.2.1]